MAKDKALKTASVLAFERKLDTSDGLFYSGKWEDKENVKSWLPLGVREKAVRGTISNRLKKALAEAPLKLDAEVQKANLQKVDVLTLPNDSDTLKIVFTLKILGNISEPNVCNNAEYQKKLQSAIQSYISETGFDVIASRYAINLANARFLWRNRIGSEDIEVKIMHRKNNVILKTWSFNAFDFSLRNFDVSASYQKNIQELAQVIEKGLQGESYTLLEIEAFARIGRGQEVFPSQELILEKSREKNKKSKILYAIETGDLAVAAMHSQKIGNALRTIDDWHAEALDIGPISIEPYGSVTSRGKAYRTPTEAKDFYTLFDAWIVHDKKPSLDEQHYVVANLIRGGVFGESGKE